MLREVRPDVVVGDACRRFEGLREKRGISGASRLAQAAIATDARAILLEVSRLEAEVGEGKATSSENGERAIYSLNEPIISLNRTHTMGEKPTEGYITHPADAARPEEAEELHFNDYTKITTGQKRCVIPQTVSKSAAANVIADVTSPPMLRVELAVQDLLGKPVPAIVELEGLVCMVFGTWQDSERTPGSGKPRSRR